MSIAFLGLGSNVNAVENIRSGIAALDKRFEALRLSPVYLTPAVGFDGAPFINLAASVETELQPLELKHFLNGLEDRHGRKRNVAKFSDRTLDIDILLYDDLYLMSPLLEIPRREILAFAHVLKPLADLAPDLVHPVERVTLATLWERFQGDRSVLRPIGLDA